MELFSYIVIFICSWWVLFYVMLPFGVAHGATPDVTGQEAGAPKNPYLGIKMLITTILATIATWCIQQMMPRVFAYLMSAS